MKIGRNAPCPCGSGKKYKKCCLAQDETINFQVARDKKMLEKVNRELIAFDEKQDFDSDFGQASNRYFDLDYPFREESSDDEEDDEGEGWSDDDIDHDSLDFLNWFALDYILQDGCRVIDHFLHQGEDCLTQEEKQLALLLNDSYPSLYEIIETIPGKGIKLKDLLMDRELFVYEKSATEQLYKSLVISARIIAMNTHNYIVDIGPIFPPLAAKELIDDIQAELNDHLEEYNEVMTMPAFLKEMGGEFIKRFHLYWEEERQRMFISNLHTTDGDKLVFVTTYYEVLDFASARLGLNCFPGLDVLEDTENEYKAHWIVETPDGPMPSVIYGDITLTAKRLTLECKSHERLSMGKELLAEHLGISIKQKVDKIQDASQMMNESFKNPPKPSAEPPISSKEINEALAQYYEEHYRKWPDKEIPALNNKTPRQAANDPELREKLICLLKEFDCMEERRKRGGEYSYDMNKVRKELGLIQ
jgi:hypothetical protein